MNRATEEYEYKNPPSIYTYTDTGLPCPNCRVELEWQDRLNLACPGCENGYGILKEQDNGTLITDEWGHPVAKMLGFYYNTTRDRP